MAITGKHLIEWGYKPGKWFPQAVALAGEMQARGENEAAIRDAVAGMAPVTMPMRDTGRPYAVLLQPENELEAGNLRSVAAHMDELMRVPTIEAGAVMPDACPSGAQIGTIPVGGVVAARDAIHPGFHSADICCSVAISVFRREDDPKRLLDAVHEVTHFGPGGRRDDVTTNEARRLIAGMGGNPFLAGLEVPAAEHFGTQGDGNHFAYVGRLKSTGQLALVTHHGSRGLGAQLYKRGMSAAQKHTARAAEGVPAHNAWLQASSAEGESYWQALQVVRAWTKANHFVLHDLAAERFGQRVEDRFWNEHNFVFQKPDGLFYHGKGATPSWSGFAADDSGLTLIPLNMAEPILITRHRANEAALGFAPHGAGRNMGRRAFLREHGEQPIPAGIDHRPFCGVIDHSELPGAYKDAATVRRQIQQFGLAAIVDEVQPYGCIMAGDWERDMPWRKGKRG